MRSQRKCPCPLWRAMIFFLNYLLCVRSDKRMMWCSVRRDDLSKSLRGKYLWALAGTPCGICILHGWRVVSPAIQTWTKDQQYYSPQAHKGRVCGENKTKQNKAEFFGYYVWLFCLYLDFFGWLGFWGVFLVLFLVVNMCGLGMDRGRWRQFRWMQNGSYHQSSCIAEHTVSSSAPSSAATGYIDSICSGKWCNCFTSSTKINVCISSEQAHKWEAAL